MSNKNYSYQDQKQRENQKNTNKQNKAKQYRRNLQSRARQKDWQQMDDTAWEDKPADAFERIMARDENDRRRRVENSAQAERQLNLGLSHATDGSHGVVMEVSTGLCRVWLNQDEVLCAVRGSLTAQETGFTNAIAVGDHVLVDLQPDGSGMIEAVLPRKSVLTRPASGSSRQQALVANADKLLIVAAWRNPHIWPEMIDRYLIVAERNHLPAVLCINKIDLAESQQDLSAFASIYRDLQLDVVLTSTTSGVGIDWLRENLRGKLTVLTGLSGVGKSSLLSQVQPGLQLKAKTVSEASGEGRHTTTQSNLYHLQMGGAVVDTPGIREFGLAGIRPAELAGYFPEFQWQADGCRFNDCRHLEEPDCSVRRAVENGFIAETRYQSYRKILAEM
ncbi:MAG: ribosome small subunit-dependent GTPase A [Anaerolineae bacterium]|nr:ribosome small subunit-dependent GTPase A [Anaerolineae bacterium]